ncbi:hypothetical protein NUU61_005324 [Penicillium alfredii]|uniref:Uncharacterized protein n=1 Tax=Penicillium alfredii TaxID=1506179 RepID=A0A9W9K7H1_9EURO|nr:uncharacterized protein NUU61_005324 [Penicillium alfredii]KAJ5095968.1 hypothetical protein NUU61_005324 [Penicillium alfredii]
MYIPQKRDTTNKNNVFIICAACIIFVLSVCVIVYFGSRYLRQQYHEPKYIPGQYLKRKWKQWCPGSASYGQVPSPAAGNADQDTSYRGGGQSGPEMNTTGVQRETSVRSIMTLPAYSPSPKPTEQIIAREGERNGMDMVVEYPETAEEQEARREEQMDALYQLRLQRRQELAEREARRRDRREARARGDSARLEQLAVEARARSQRTRPENSSSTSVNASTVMAEHQSRERERRISSVSYASIGHVRHDGSRLRADSHDSDHHPLLQHATINESTPSLEDPTSMHSRVESFASSTRTTSTLAADPDLSLTPSVTGGSSRPLSQADDGDLGASDIPPPPEYDHLDWGDAPAYESPITERNEGLRRLPSLAPLPAIQVNVASPLATSPVTPTASHQHERENEPSTPTGPAQEPERTTSPPPHGPCSSS